MSSDRLLLVHPPSGAEWRGIFPHIGHGFLAQTLVENGVEYSILDMNLGYNAKDLLRRIEGYRPNLVGMSLLSLEYKKFYHLLSEIKRLHPGVKTVVGGPHVTILKDQALHECPAIDYGVVGEGEGTLLELCQGKPEDQIAGLLFRDGGDIIYNGDRPYVSDLDKLPWPRLEGFELQRYIHTMTIYSSRGCPNQCTFCPNPLMYSKFRARSARDVVDEMEYWYARGRRQFNFDDDNFNMFRDRVFEVCDEIERRGLKKLFLTCSNGIRADRVDREMLSRMWEVGFRSIAFGADGGNNKILRLVKKGETIESIEEAVKTACEVGYGVKLLFVVGTPYETWEDVEDKVRLSRKYPIQEAHFYNTIPYPGTELHDWIRENKLFLRQPEDYLNDVSCLTDEPVFETPELRAADRIRLYRYLAGVRKQIHKDAVQRVLKQRNGVGRLVSYLLSQDFVERLYLRSIFFRRLIEGLRYRQEVSKQPQAGSGRCGIEAGTAELLHTTNRSATPTQPGSP